MEVPLCGREVSCVVTTADLIIRLLIESTSALVFLIDDEANRSKTGQEIPTELRHAAKAVTFPANFGLHIDSLDESRLWCFRNNVGFKENATVFDHDPNTNLIDAARGKL